MIAVCVVLCEPWLGNVMCKEETGNSYGRFVDSTALIWY